MTKLDSVLDSEFIIKSFYSEDLADGPVASWQSGGSHPVTLSQANTAMQPTKTADGVVFSGAQNLSMPTDQDAPFEHRWWVAIARCNSFASGQVNVITCNSDAGTRQTGNQPRIFFQPNAMSSLVSDGILRQIDGPSQTDGTSWNVLVGFSRSFTHQAIVNGVKLPPVPFAGNRNGGGNPTFMGAKSPTASLAEMTIDCVITGQGILSDSEVDRIVGWAMWRAGRQADLPLDHPCHDAPPADMDSQPHYGYDPARWSQWTTDVDAIRYTNRGQPAPPALNYQVVFFDNFNENTVVGDLDYAPAGPWYAPGWLNNICGDAQVAPPVDPTGKPTCYVHDPVHTTMSLRLQADPSGSNRRSGAFMSVNKVGYGRTWKTGIFEIRCRFPLLAPADRPGFFPAFWAYGVEHLFWHTRNRLETDFFEYDALDGTWINTTQHVHDPRIIGPLCSPSGPIVQPGPHAKKLFGYPVNPTNGFAAPIDIYDGQFHTWYIQIEDDFTYMVLDGLEVGRVPTSPELAAEKYLIVDWAYVPNKGLGTFDPAKTYDMTIDYIKVRQKTAIYQAVPAGFTARPTLSTQSPIVGQPLTVMPNTSGQLEYYWYHNNMPIMNAPTDTFTPTTAHLNHKINVMVRNVSYPGRPSAWTSQTLAVKAS